jgi:hypothetical protein
MTVLTLLILLCTAALPLYTSWSGLAGNQTVSFANAQDAVTNGVFTLKNTITSSNRQMTKSDAYNHLYIDPGHSSFLTKSYNQLVVKNDLVSSPCRQLLVTVSYEDLSNAVDHKVHFAVLSCNQVSVDTLHYDTPLTNFNTGYCYRPGHSPGPVHGSIGWIMTTSGAAMPNSSWSSDGSICNNPPVQY